MPCCGDGQQLTNCPPGNPPARFRPCRPRPALEQLQEDQKRYAMQETDDCRKGIVRKYIWSTTYREMNKDGAPLPLAVLEKPASSQERPPGDPLARAAELAPFAMMNLGEVFEKWDRPQVRKMAGRCDTMYNRPDLGHDSYFQEHRLCRAKLVKKWSRKLWGH
ncbi:hypothetical protein Fcan01_15272 [Folsomia candida]|uniref:Uncharacterized protein n=1 Tax=Folsomia candida TaxID=158441 RepID=A0A226DY09_FOLCA|nr:hypothetical protein Fcan01_15272 [Folsomia candida]